MHPSLVFAIGASLGRRVSDRDRLAQPASAGRANQDRPDSLADARRCHPQAAHLACALGSITARASTPDA